MNAGYKKATSKLLAAVLSLLMVFGNVASPLSGVFNVYATDEETVANAEEITSEAAAVEEITSEEDQQDQENADADAVSEDAAAEEETSEASDENKAAEPEGEEENKAKQPVLLKSAPAFSGKVYIDGKNGNDEEGDGLSKETAVKTWARAMEIIGDNEGEILVCGTVEVSDEVSTKYPEVKQVVKRAEGFTGNIFSVDKTKKTATFKNIHINGEEKSVKTTAIAFEDIEGGELNLGENLLVENMNSTAAGGGAVYVGKTKNSRLTINGAVFKGNKAPNGRGGAVYIYEKEPFEEDNFILEIGSQTEFKNNSAEDGGALAFQGPVDVNGATRKVGTFTIDGAEFSNNEASNQGGAIYLNGEIEFVMKSGLIAENKADQGAAIVNYNSTLENTMTFYNVLITGNKSTATEVPGNAAQYLKNSGVSAGGINICQSSVAETTISTSEGAAIYGNKGPKGDIAVWNNSDVTKLKINEGNMLGGGNHRWEPKTDKGYEAKPLGPDIDKANAEGRATTKIINNEAKFHGAIQSNGVITLGKALASLRVKKVDSKTGEALNGVVFVLKGKTTTGVEVDREAATFVDKSGSEHDNQGFGVASFTDIAAGSYELTEKEPLSGYKKVDTKWHVNVDSDGNLTMKDADGNAIDKENAYYDYIIENEPIEVKFSKADLNGVEIEGAEIEVRDSDGNVVETWKSGNDAHVINLPKGDYTMTEIVAPKGFEPVTTDIEFSVDEYGEVTLKTAKVNNGGAIELHEGDHIVLKDAPYKEPQTEKYVNKVVTENFEYFNEVFEYEIMAYVPYDATKLTITDELVNALEFANGGNVKVYNMGADNDHKPIGTVAKTGEEIKDADITASGQNLEVKIEDAEPYRSNWIKVTFDAQIKETEYKKVQNLIEKRNAGNAITDADWAAVTDNGLVLTEEVHDGIPNKAKYTVETKNNGEFDPETNTVTVEPKTVDLKVKKSWSNILWPTDTEVTFGIYRHENGKDEKVDEITLDSNETSKTVTLPKIKGATYSAKEIKVKKDGVESVEDANGNFIIGAINYIASFVKNLFAGDSDGEFEISNKVEVDVEISKTDLGGEELVGAEMELYKGDKAQGNPKDSWTSTGSAHDLKLEPGTYTLKEVVAPEGYQTVTTEIVFEVKEDGTVKLVKTTVDNDGQISVQNGNHVVLEDAPNKPAIEKYVNKKVADADLDDNKTGRDETVHTDLSAFYEVYTYDIQAYITADAKYVKVNDELREVLEFVGDAPVRVVVKDGDGKRNEKAPALTKAGEEVNYEFDAEAWKAGKLVLTMGSDAEDAPKLYPNGKWLQITFDAKIKDEYKSVEALKAKGENVWTTITEDNPIDDPADTVDEFSGAVAGNHEGIWNDSDYQIKKVKSTAGTEVGNEWDYELKSNTVTVQPKSKEVTFSKTDLGGNELEGATIKVVDENGNVVDEWTSTTKDHVLHLADGEYTMIEVAAPEGYQQVTTEMGFTVDVENDKVTLTTVQVNNGGKLRVENNEHIILEDAPEKPAIEKYVNKKTDDLADAERDGTVHTDLSAFNEVYTYDIQAYITADATVVEVTDELKSILEFAGDAPTAVVVKDGEGDSKAVAPKLTKAGEDVEYTLDAEAWANGKLVLTIGSDAANAPKLYPNGKWLQITFDAKIKDEYKSIEALKAAGADVWTEITENDPIDDADVVDAFSGAVVEAHEGIVNDASYRVKSIVAGLNVDDGFAYSVKSNTVTVQPPATEVSFSKTDLEGKELPGAEIVLTDAEGNVIDKWTSTTEDHILNLADGEYIMTEKASPEGYYCVTTEIHFVVKDGEVTLTTAVVDNGGEIEVLAGNHIILKDAPKVQSEYEEPKEDEGEEEVVVRTEKVTEESEVKEAYSKRVNTGDDTTLYIWAVMLMISLLSAVITIIRRRRTN